jgi:membrane fusion protein (multidrug efflux system)
MTEPPMNHIPTPCLACPLSCLRERAGVRAGRHEVRLGDFNAAPSPRPSPARGRGRSIGTAVVVAALLAACGRNEPAAAPAAMPPPQVGVVTVSTTTVPMATELPGRVEAARTAEVRARVTGVVHKRLFREGSDVKAGQALFQIDPAPYQATLASARAQLAKAQANLQQAVDLDNRYRPLREANAISEQEYISARSARAQAEADVAAGRAAVQTAQLNLGYATVTAPIAGRIGRAIVSEGALVSAAEATQMATIQQVNPVYVNLTQPVSELRRLREAVSRGAATLADSVPVQVIGDDGRPLQQPGRLLFSDLSVDPATGEVSLRAEVPNPNNELLPGLYVRVRLAQAQFTGAVLLPQQAVTRNAQGDTVLVVGDDNKPVTRTVRIGGGRDGQWVVLDGLKPGERVVVEGFQKLRPGSPVAPVAWAASAPAANAAGNAAVNGAAPAAGPGSAASR